MFFCVFCVFLENDTKSTKKQPLASSGTLGYVHTTHPSKTAGRCLKIDLKGILGILGIDVKQKNQWQTPEYLSYLMGFIKSSCNSVSTSVRFR